MIDLTTFAIIPVPSTIIIKSCIPKNKQKKYHYALKNLQIKNIPGSSFFKKKGEAISI